MTRASTINKPDDRKPITKRRAPLRIKGLDEQLHFDLEQSQPYRRETFVVSPANAEAVARIDAWPAWPGGVLALIGPAGSGKSHLALAWAERVGAATPSDLVSDRPVLIEDADSEAQGEALFHLLNRPAPASLLLTARTLPTIWATALPDLRSRLNAFPVASLGEPNDEVLDGVMRRLFRERHIEPAHDLLVYLRHRIERSEPAARAFIARLDAEALRRQKPVTRALARDLLKDSDETTGLFDGA